MGPTLDAAPPRTDDAVAPPQRPGTDVGWRGELRRPPWHGLGPSRPRPPATVSRSDAEPLGALPDPITLSQFAAVALHVGTVVRAEPFPEARTPAVRLEIDFGPQLGRRWSSAQLTERYAAAALVGRQVVAVTNLPPRRVAGFVSEVLVLGAVPRPGDPATRTPPDVVLLAPDAPVPDGTRIA